MQRQVAAAEGQPRIRARSVILLFNGGGIPQHESWDPKPEAPPEVRGEFGAIATRTPSDRDSENCVRACQSSGLLLARDLWRNPMSSAQCWLPIFGVRTILCRTRPSLSVAAYYRAAPGS
jgi:hypothetical protein